LAVGADRDSRERQSRAWFTSHWRELECVPWSFDQAKERHPPSDLLVDPPPERHPLDPPDRRHPPGAAEQEDTFAARCIDDLAMCLRKPSFPTGINRVYFFSFGVRHRRSITIRPEAVAESRAGDCLAAVAEACPPWDASESDIFAVEGGRLLWPCIAHGIRPWRNELSRDQAASLAARLANDACEIAFSARPFSPSSWPAVQGTDRTWSWGKETFFGPAGYSAVVSFGPEGENPRVRVYRDASEQ
jgi:hypothetical protein